MSRADGTLTDIDVLEAEVKRAMLEQAEESVLLLDGSKLAAHGRQAIAPLAAVTLVLADGLADERRRAPAGRRRDRPPHRPTGAETIRAELRSLNL